VDGETKNEGSDEGFTDTEKWAQEVLERAKNRSEGSFDTENTPLEDDSKSKIKDVDELEVSQIHDQTEESFRGSIVTLEDIEGEQPITPLSLDVDEKSSNSNNDFFPSVAKRTRKSVVEWTIVLVGAIGLALIIKAFLFQAYYIPSPSMNPTLLEGDRILVNKLSYDLHSVNRGDLIVFSTPEKTESSDDLIKRVIGLPGEFVTVEDGRIEIDGGLLLEPYLPLQTEINSFSSPINCVNRPEESAGCRVPADHVFVMGDNRSNSRDSRFFGPVPTEDIEGRAFIRIWPFGDFKRL
jgi:signal peptidase I|tara:strand:- start:2262 stop:3146 length:885 start_codon:yes stop_codon:yes gene_type:complete